MCVGGVFIILVPFAMAPLALAFLSLARGASCPLSASTVTVLLSREQEALEASKKEETSLI